MVLVKNGYPLEPNYVVIEDLTNDVKEDNIKRINLTKMNLNHRDVILKIVKTHDYSKFCNLIFDFKDNFSILEHFID